MAELIRVDYDELEQVAARFNQESAQIETMLFRIRMVMNQLRDEGWIGRGSESFFHEMDELVVPAVVRLIEALGEAGSATLQVKSVMEDAESDASSGFRDHSFGGGFGGRGGWGGFGGSSFGADAFGATSGGRWDSGGFNPNGGGSGGSGFAGGFGGLTDGGGGGGFDALVDSIFGPNSQFGEGLGLFNNLLGENGFLTNEGGRFGGDGTNFGFFDELGLGLDGDASNGFSVPDDWLDGVTASLSDSYGGLGVPDDWLSGLSDASATEAGGAGGGAAAAGDAGGSGGGGGSTGGGGSSGGGGSAGGDSGLGSELSAAMPTFDSPSFDNLSTSGSSFADTMFSGGGSSGGGGSPPFESPSLSSSEPDPTGGGGGGSGSAMPPSEINAPRSDDAFRTMFAPSDTTRVASSGGDGATSAQYSSTAGQVGRERAPVAPPSITLGGGGQGGGGAAPAAGSSGGIPMGLAAASPFVALLGKMLFDKKGDES